MNVDAKAQDVLAKTVEVIAQEYQPEEIVLFGSYAYGTPDPDSDIDLLIVKKTEKPFFQRLLPSRTLSGIGKSS